MRKYKSLAMKNLAILLCIVVLASCGNSIKLAVPTVFKEQATMMHVSGARGNKMSFGNYKSSRIKRGMHLTYPGWGRGFFLENLLLNNIGLQKSEHVQKEKAQFRYSLSDGKNNVDVFGKERELTRSLEYKLSGAPGIFNSFERIQDHQYIFSAILQTDAAQNDKTWELIMSNVYDRKKDTSRSLFTVIRPDDDGMATNGKDSIFIKPISLKNTESANGKQGRLLVKMLSGYELSTRDGVIAVIDAIDRNIWFYNELSEADKLLVAGISTAIFARKVNDTKW
ncbi:hypothetical protein [Ferruginibacter profundus]